MVMTLAELIEPADWMDGAVCRQVDPELFFPEKGGTTVPAKRVCGGCDVKAECLAHAIQHGEQHGIWGGLSAHDRARLNGHRGRQSEATEWCPECERGPWSVRGLQVHLYSHRAAS